MRNLSPLAPAALLLALFVVTATANVLPVSGQDAADGAGQSSPEARAAWARILGASSGEDPNRAPITAFTIRAEALTRSGPQTNESKFDYQYLAPDCIRFELPSGSVTGRSGRKQRDYWLRTKDGITDLAGFEYAEDRRQVQEMHAIAKNFVALTDPSKLNILSLEILPEPPPELWDTLRRTTKRMEWLRLTSPDFSLTKRDDMQATGGAPKTNYVVDVALPQKDYTGAAKDLPVYAIIREARVAGQPAAQPMLIRLRNYANQDGFLMPLELQVFALESLAPDATTKPTFELRPAQEVWVIEANLRPGLTEADFTANGG